MIHRSCLHHRADMLPLPVLLLAFGFLSSFADAAIIHGRSRLGNHGGSSSGGAGGGTGSYGMMNNINMGQYWDMDSNYSELETMHDEQALITRLLWNYDPAARPVYNASHEVGVKFSFALIQLCDMDERNQILTTNVWLENEWVDERLTWNRSDYNDIDKIRIPCNRVWLPDIVLYNSADDYTEGYMQAKIVLEADGNIFWSPPAKLRSSCKIDVTYFPFDDQTCFLKFGSWTYSGLQLNLLNRSSDVDLINYVPSGEWELRGALIERNVQYYPCCPTEPYYDLIFYVFIRRKVLYYLFNIIFPCIWLSVLSVIGFWLPPDSGEKVTLGITVLLAFSVFMLLIAENIPATSETVPLIGIYLTAVMSLTSMSIILTVFVLQLHHSGQFAPAMPKRFYRFVTITLAGLVGMDEQVRRFEAAKYAPKRLSAQHQNQHQHQPKDFNREELKSALVECQKNFNLTHYDLGNSLKKQKQKDMLCLSCICCCFKSSDQSSKKVKKSQVITDRSLKTDIRFISNKKNTIASFTSNDHKNHHVELIQHENKINYDLLEENEHDLCIANKILRPKKYKNENKNVLIDASLFNNRHRATDKQVKEVIYNPMQSEGLKTRLAYSTSPGANRHVPFNLFSYNKNDPLLHPPLLISNSTRQQHKQENQNAVQYPNNQICTKCNTNKNQTQLNYNHQSDQNQSYSSPISLRHVNHTHGGSQQRSSQEKCKQVQRTSSEESQQTKTLYIRTKEDSIDENIQLQNEWKLLALIFDRVLFWIFSVLIGSTSVFLLVLVPLMKDDTIAIPKNINN